MLRSLKLLRMTLQRSNHITKSGQATLHIISPYHPTLRPCPPLPPLGLSLQHFTQLRHAQACYHTL